jgi:hypothetical protein
MAKVVNPLLSIDATGSVGKSLTFSHWKGKNVGKFKIQRNLSNTADQITVRSLITDASKAWASNATVGGVVIDAAYKLAYDNYAIGKQFSGFNAFIKQTVALNGGSSYDGSLEIPVSPTA